MHGYDDATYGEAFADVYDEWYPHDDDTATAVAALAALAGEGRVLELAVGTGRLAVPLAATGLEVHGIDTSPAMLARLAAKPGGEAVKAVCGDMVVDLPAGPFALVFVADNSLFNLRSEERQVACFSEVAARLEPGGAFVVQAFVPDPTLMPANSVRVRTLAADRVVLSVSVTEPAAQRAEGQYIDIGEAGGVRLRPWSIRWATPAQLDAMAAAAGLALGERWAAFDRSAFQPDSQGHVSVFRRGEM
jgi:SAM-dependent methyltransferase